MACCVVGSLLLVGLMSLLRLIRERLLGLAPKAPEQWRLVSDRVASVPSRQETAVVTSGRLAQRPHPRVLP